MFARIQRADISIAADNHFPPWRVSSAQIECGEINARAHTAQLHISHEKNKTFYHTGKPFTNFVKRIVLHRNFSTGAGASKSDDLRQTNANCE
jgi:hypothetical protein